jgi:PAS domain S-box-containing protein
MNQKNRYLLASIVESSQDSIVSIDLNQIVTSWNGGAEQLYGFKAEEVIGKPLEIVMLPKDIAELIKKVASIVAEVTVPIYETVRVHKNGKQADLEILLSPVRNAQGEVVGVSTVARDISVRKMQERQKDEFIAVASHELKTPVTSIKAFTELIIDHLEELGDESCIDIARKLDRQIDNLISLIGTLLDTTSLAAGEMLLHTESFDLNTLIAEQVEALKPVWDKHNLAIRAGAIGPVTADRKLIGRVITNFISNACKYSPDGGPVIISSAEIAEGVEVRVQDFGVGIPEEVREKIFERYFRVEHPETTNVSGIGLGLYISAGILRQQGGSIAVESSEGEGSIFSFRLPYAEHRN